MATAYKKISELLPVDAATLTNDEPIPTVQAGATRAITGNRIMTEAGFRGSGSYVVGLKSLIRSLIQGLKLTRASTTTFSVAPGVVGDSTFTQGMELLATTTKSTSAWAVGNAGGLDTGAIANSTWYAVYLIMRPDTELVDVIFSTNGTSPTMPANYTLFRRIGWLLTNGSAQFVDFTQFGRRFLWKSSVTDMNAVDAPNTTRNLATVTTPANVVGLLHVVVTNPGTGQCMVGETVMTDAAASLTNHTHSLSSSATRQDIELELQVDASRQIFHRSSTTSNNITLLTRGWIDDLSD